MKIRRRRFAKTKCDRDQTAQPTIHRQQTPEGPAQTHAEQPASPSTASKEQSSETKRKRNVMRIMKLRRGRFRTTKPKLPRQPAQPTPTQRKSINMTPRKQCRHTSLATTTPTTTTPTSKVMWAISAPVPSDNSESSDDEPWILPTPLMLDSENTSFEPVIDGHHPIQSTPKTPTMTQTNLMTIPLDISPITPVPERNNVMQTTRQTTRQIWDSLTPPQQPIAHDPTITNHNYTPAIDGHTQHPQTLINNSETDEHIPIDLSPIQSVATTSQDAVFFLCVPTLWNNS